MDMPVQAADVLQMKADVLSFGSQIADYWPAIEIVKETWSKNTLRQITDGRVAIPDSVINKTLSSYISGNEAIQSLEIESVGDKKFMLRADLKKTGKVHLLCRMEEFIHSETDNRVKIKVLEKDLPDNSLMSWIFSRVSLSMTQKFIGKIDFGDNVETKIKGNRVTVDFSKALQASPAGKTELFGKPVCDLVLIDTIVPRDGYMEVAARFNASDEVKAMLLRAAKTEGFSN